jgi:hypothetical protein
VRVAKYVCTALYMLYREARMKIHRVA